MDPTTGRFFVRVIPEENQSENLGDPWDWASFGWGVLTGGVITIVIGGVVLYFTWPYLLAFLKVFAGAEVIRGLLE